MDPRSKNDILTDEEIVEIAEAYEEAEQYLEMSSDYDPIYDDPFEE